VDTPEASMAQVLQRVLAAPDLQASRQQWKYMYYTVRSRSDLI
jgi:hypothetical protein